MASLEGLLNTDFMYPGIEIKVELILMQEYLNQMEVGVKAICDAYLERETKKYANAEYYEYQHIYSIAEEEIPRLIRLPLMVSIYTIYENSITQLLSYAQTKENAGLTLKDINGKSLSSTFNKYMKHVLGFDFQISSKAMQQINTINKIRNCIAHANGNLSSLSKEKISELRVLEDSRIGVEITSMQIDISYSLIKSSMTTVENIVRELMNFMENRYGFN
jgi:hypothetical protein